MAFQRWHDTRAYQPPTVVSLFVTRFKLKFKQAERNCVYAIRNHRGAQSNCHACLSNSFPLLSLPNLSTLILSILPTPAYIYRFKFVSCSCHLSLLLSWSQTHSTTLTHHPLMAPENHHQESSNSILVTGGAGFIGTHTVLQLLNEGYRVSIIDNLDNSVEDAVDRVRDLAGSSRSGNLQFHVGDLRNKEDLEKVFSRTRFDAVIHFAGLKAVGESVAKPSLYYNNNLIGTLNLFEFMTKYGCKKMVFSSSATVYGQPETIPCVEDFQLMAMNPYGRTKLFLEEIARDIQKADPEWRIILLRYFNPVGADMSGQIGEDPKGIPNNLMPYIQQVAVGRLPVLNVFGYDYPTKDGSAIRDYIHVVDLADGHIAALRKIFSKDQIGCVAYNLGTGRGTSVLEMVAAFEKASGKKIPVKLCPRRPGDATAVYASTEKAKKELGWKAKYGIEEMCRDQWNWARKNPWGYRPQP